MAGDWIKMRVAIDRDPCVIAMADFLAEEREFMDWLTDPVRKRCETSAYEHVTRNVIVALCVTGLLVTWGAARDRGDRIDDDLVLDRCRIETVSAISGIPKFGEAMQDVGWAHEHEIGRVVFPKFFKANETPDEKHKRQAAERQAKFRAKQVEESNVAHNVRSNGVRNVTVTPREEKRRDNPIVPLPGFLGFWTEWPVSERKGSKSKCADLWRKNKLEAHAGEIIDHVRAMKKSRQWSDSKFIPAPLAYLNQAKWEGAEIPGPEDNRLPI